MYLVYIIVKIHQLFNENKKYNFSYNYGRREYTILYHFVSFYTILFSISHASNTFIFNFFLIFYRVMLTGAPEAPFSIFLFSNHIIRKRVNHQIGLYLCNLLSNMSLTLSISQLDLYLCQMFLNLVPP
jgi:hypothetical protein